MEMGHSEQTEKHGVIFAIVKDGIIQLEHRLKIGSALFGFNIVPGGTVEEGETYEEALVREMNEEYSITPKNYEFLGSDSEIEVGLAVTVRHVFLITDWEGVLSNPEAKNGHIEATLEEARKLCAHPISQRILDMIEARLSR